MVTVRPRAVKNEIDAGIILPEWAEEKAREIAREKGYDYYRLRADWMDFAKAEAGRGNPAKNAGAAFVKFCQNRKSVR